MCSISCPNVLAGCLGTAFRYRRKLSVAMYSQLSSSVTIFAKKSIATESHRQIPVKIRAIITY